LAIPAIVSALMLIVICGDPRVDVVVVARCPAIAESIVLYNEPPLILQANFGASDQRTIGVSQIAQTIDERAGGGRREA
jgi:hypothetical protein